MILIFHKCLIIVSMFSNLHVLPKKAIVIQNSNEFSGAESNNKVKKQVKKVENVRVISRDNVVGMHPI